MSDGEPRLNKRPSGKDCLPHRSWRSYRTPLKGPLAEVKEGCRQLGEGPEAHALLGSMDGVLWGSGAKAGLVHSNQKEKGFAEGGN